MEDIEKTNEHCKFKENSCKNYCLSHCDHFAHFSHPEASLSFKCPGQDGNYDHDEDLLPSHKDVEEYLINFVAGKMCLS